MISLKSVKVFFKNPRYFIDGIFNDIRESSMQHQCALPTYDKVKCCLYFYTGSSKQYQNLGLKLFAHSFLRGISVGRKIREIFMDDDYYEF